MHYSIAELEKYTGIKAHTIRMWEQRYEVLTPQRTETNIRYYDDDQLRKLLNVASLVRSGMRISRISKMTDQELSEALDSIMDNGQSEVSYIKDINDLLTAALTFNEALFQKTFANCLLKYGLEDTYVHVLHPVLARTGLMWATGDMSVCQEHFVSNLVRQKLYTASDKLANPKPDAKTWVLFLPGEEEHDIGLLYANYLIRQYGARAIYLGQRVPFKDIVDNVERLKPDYMLTFLKHTNQIEHAQEFLDRLNNELGDFRPLVSGNPEFLKELNIPDKVTLLLKPEMLMEYLKSS